MVTWVEDTEPGFRSILLSRPTLPNRPSNRFIWTKRACVGFSTRTIPVRGKLELDYIFGSIPIGKENERKRCASIALAVDADTGMVYAPEVIDATVPCAAALSKVFLSDSIEPRTANRSPRTQPEA